MQQAKDTSKREKLAKELETASAQEELKLTQLQRAQDLLKQRGWYCRLLFVPLGQSPPECI